MILNSPNTSGTYTAPQSIVMKPGFSTMVGQFFSASIVEPTSCNRLATILSANQNHIVTYVPRLKGITNPADPNFSNCEVMTSIQYADGLGRPLQSVQVKGSPDGLKDLVQPIAYDQYGRESIKFLPYVTASGPAGSYRNAALAEQLNFYYPANQSQQPNGVVRTNKPFAVTGFELSPLNRTLEQGAPGVAWQLPENTIADPNSSRHTSKTEYASNNQTPLNPTPGSTNKGSQQVVLYTANVNNDQSATLGRIPGKAYYESNQLQVSINKDENWQPADGCLKTTEEYKDKEGNVILRRTYNKTADNEVEMLSTLHIR